jgi:tripartite-type tricarboxylate transporter receptor subunit TctC
MKCLLVTCQVLLAAVAMSAAAAADYPDHPVRLIVPFAPGGPTDVMARHLGNALRDHLGQPIIVDNRAGAGGNIGAEAVAKAAPDGYTLLFGTSGPLAINAGLYPKLNYDPLTSFDPVIMIGHLPNVLTVHPDLPVRTADELIALAKSGRRLTFASSGNGASSHLAGVMFNAMTGTNIQHVPYRGTGPALNDLLAGQVDMTFTDVLTALPHIQAGTLRALGVTTAERSAVLPDVPTLAEQGLHGFDVSVFFGIIVPKGTPPAVIGKLNQAFASALDDAELRRMLTAQGIVRAPSTEPAFLTRFMSAEIPKWRQLIKSAGIEVQ